MESGEFTAEKVRPSVSVRNSPTSYTHAHAQMYTYMDKIWILIDWSNIQAQPDFKANIKKYLLFLRQYDYRYFAIE